MKAAIIYCDGSAIGNPGPGGWGAVVFHPAHEGEKKVTEHGGDAVHTTNNRMELTAAIEALRHVPHDSVVTIKTDSQYVINGITKWAKGWERNGWQTTQKKDVLNKDLWEALVRVSKKHTITWEHVRGHVGVALNERADQIANGFARKERVKLFKGNDREYTEFLKGMPKARAVSSSASKKGKAYSYVSLVGGVVMTHATWTACEERVKGEKAKFKKVFSEEEEKELRALWSN